MPPGLQQSADSETGGGELQNDDCKGSEGSVKIGRESEDNTTTEKFMPGLIPVEERLPHFEETLYKNNKYHKKKIGSKRVSSYNLQKMQKKTTADF